VTPRRTSRQADFFTTVEIAAKPYTDHVRRAVSIEPALSVVPGNEETSLSPVPVMVPVEE
jgi:hypothetical protein